MLATKNLSRAVDGKFLVDDISVQVEAGEILAVVGPSGAGKSSFLRLLNRLDEPTGGTVPLDGLDYKDIPPRELRRRVGMVMQMAAAPHRREAKVMRSSHDERWSDHAAQAGGERNSAALASVKAREQLAGAR